MGWNFVKEEFYRILTLAVSLVMILFFPIREIGIPIAAILIIANIYDMRNKRKTSEKHRRMQKATQVENIVKKRLEDFKKRFDSTTSHSIYYVNAKSQHQFTTSDLWERY